MLTRLLITLWLLLLPVSSWAAISYVGGQTAGVAGTTSAVTVNFALTGGSDAAPLVGDLVVVTWTFSHTLDEALIIDNQSGTDYTLAGAELFANDLTFDTNLRVAYRVMPDPTETAVVLSSGSGGTGGSVNSGGSYTIHVFRGVHATPLEQAVTGGTATNTWVVNPGSITPTTAGAVVYVSGGGAGGTGAGGVYTSSDLTAFLSSTQEDVRVSNIGAGYFAWSAGEFVPATFGGGGTDSTDNSYAWAIIVLAPAAEAAGTALSSGSNPATIPGVGN